jgi:hypothetical protein
VTAHPPPSRARRCLPGVASKGLIGTKFTMTAGRKYVLDHVNSFDALSSPAKTKGPFVECSPEMFKRLNVSDEKIAASYRDANGRTVPLAAGCIVRGRLSRELFLSVLDEVPDVPAFVAAVDSWASANKIHELIVELIVACDQEPDISDFPEYTELLTADLYLVDVFKEGLTFSSNHRRNINKAKNLGIHLIDQSPEAAIADHFRLRQSSFDRRSARGEQIFESFPMRYFSTGHGKLWQCGLDGEVLSSNLIVFGLDGAWHYESAGTSPDGFKKGASHFLHAAIMDAAREASIRWYDLGGAAPTNPGLARFKEGFATHRWKKVELHYDLTPSWVRQLNAVRALGARAASLFRG